MTNHKNLKVVAFVGLPGSSVDGIIHRLNEQGIPKVSRHDIVSQINHLQSAGQHRIITNELDSLDLYKTMKHEFPGELIVVGVIVDREARHRRLSHQDSIIEDDWDHEQSDKAAVIGMADYYIVDDQHEEITLERVKQLFERLEF